MNKGGGRIAKPKRAAASKSAARKANPLPKPRRTAASQRALLADLKAENGALEKRGRDITDRKRADSRYRLLIDSAQFPAVVVSVKEARVLFINERAAAMFGVPEESAPGLFAPDFWSRKRDLARYFRLVKEQGVVKDFETELRTKSGTRMTVMLSSNLIEFAGQKANFTVFQDITERKKAELALRESEARFRSLIEGAPEAIFVQSEGRFLYLNPAMVRLVGASQPEDLLDTEYKERIAPEYLDAVHERILTQRETGSAAPFMDMEYLRLDGARVPVETTAVPVRFAGRDAHLVFVRDIAERKRAEEALRASLREKETLLREIHHRVKNNMQVISSLFSLQGGHIKDEDARRMLKEGQNRIRSMALIHEKLYQSPDLSKIDFASYLQSLAAYLIQFFSIDAAQVQLETDFGEVRLDINSAVPCGLIANELVSNALKHAFPGGRKGVIRIRLRRGEKGQVELQVEDNGVGFPQGLDFRRAESFGLQIVEMLVGQLEGTLTLDREKGTSFTLSFRELNYQKRI